MFVRSSSRLLRYLAEVLASDRWIDVKKISCEYSLLCKSTKIVVFCVIVRPARSLSRPSTALHNFLRISSYRNIFLHHSTVVVCHTMIQFGVDKQYNCRIAMYKCFCCYCKQTNIASNVVSCDVNWKGR